MHVNHKSLIFLMEKMNSYMFEIDMETLEERVKYVQRQP